MVTEKEIWQYMEEVADPEIPVISVIDLGVVRKIELIDQESVNVTITPTYSGCPAMSAISISVRLKLIEKGFKNINVINQLSPSWSTDWMTEEGKQRMKAYGIAPPTKNPHYTVAHGCGEPYQWHQSGDKRQKEGVRDA